MSVWYVEVRDAGLPHAWSLDVVRHLPCRLLVGRVAILAERPVVVSPVLGKRWLTVIHEMVREYASTLNAIRRKELRRQIDYMKSAVFTSHWTRDLPITHIFITDSLGSIPADCRTVYTVRPIVPEELETLVRSLPDGGAVIMYGEWGDGYEEVVRRLSAEM